jgi:hypothetical protein
MSATLAVDRSRLCTFTFNNGCQCRIPLSLAHPYLCTFHARKDAQAQAADTLGHQIAFDFSGRYVSFGDLTSALAHTMTALAQRRVTSRTATSFAYLGQILFQALDRAESEYLRAFGAASWKQQISGNFNTPAPDDSDDCQTDAPQSNDGEIDARESDNYQTADPPNDGRQNRACQNTVRQNDRAESATAFPHSKDASFAPLDPETVPRDPLADPTEPKQCTSGNRSPLSSHSI